MVRLRICPLLRLFPILFNPSAEDDQISSPEALAGRIGGKDSHRRILKFSREARTSDSSASHTRTLVDASCIFFFFSCSHLISNLLFPTSDVHHEIPEQWWKHKESRVLPESVTTFKHDSDLARRSGTIVMPSVPALTLLIPLFSRSFRKEPEIKNEIPKLAFHYLFTFRISSTKLRPL